jgi:hypothetical protein
MRRQEFIVRYRLAWRALERVAVRVERVASKPGRPWLWRLKSE